MLPIRRALTSVAWAAERVQIASNFSFSDLIDCIKADCLKGFFIELLQSKASFNILACLSLLLVYIVIVFFQLIEEAEDSFINELPKLKR